MQANKRNKTSLKKFISYRSRSYGGSYSGSPPRVPSSIFRIIECLPVNSNLHTKQKNYYSSEQIP